MRLPCLQLLCSGPAPRFGPTQWPESPRELPGLIMSGLAFEKLTSLRRVHKGVAAVMFFRAAGNPQCSFLAQLRLPANAILLWDVRRIRSIRSSVANDRSGGAAKQDQH